MRIAFFGGTFDPIHCGHLAIAAAAAEGFALDTVLFAPTGHQPLKPNSADAGFDDRLAMTALACASDPRFAVSSLDTPHADGSPNYTIDTLTTLKNLYPTDSLFMLAGADSFLDLRRWREPERLLSLAEWIVVSRPGFSLDDLSPLALSPAESASIHLLLSIHEEVSSTLLRQRLHVGDPCVDLLPAPVAGYIQQHHLYR